MSRDASEPTLSSSKIETREGKLVTPREECFSHKATSDGSCLSSEASLLLLSLPGSTNNDEALVSCDASEPPLCSSRIETTEDTRDECRVEHNDANGVDGISASFGASALAA